MKLSIHLKFCADCDEVFDNATRCPGCGSNAVDFVARWIPPMFWRGGSVDETVTIKPGNGAISKDLSGISRDYVAYDSGALRHIDHI